MRELSTPVSLLVEVPTQGRLFLITLNIPDSGDVQTPPD